MKVRYKVFSMQNERWATQAQPTEPLVFHTGTFQEKRKEASDPFKFNFLYYMDDALLLNNSKFSDLLTAFIPLSLK
jgi:hypothetical protein